MSLNDTNVVICLTNLKKTFDGKEFVLNGIDLTILKGSLTAIIGFSGTGKSVLLKHILGIHKSTSGKVEVLGQDMGQLNPDQRTKLRRQFGVLFQGAALFDDMTVLENVCFPLVEHRRHLGQEEIIRIASDKLMQVGLEANHFEKLPNQISGGMQKRTGLARALALDPAILLYDEPTTGLDPILTEMVNDLILETHRRRPGQTSVMVSHDLAAAFQIADCVAMLHGGKVLLSGTPKDFLKTDVELVKTFVEKGLRQYSPIDK